MAPPARKRDAGCAGPLAEYVIGGIETTLPLHQRLVDDPNSVRGAYDITGSNASSGGSTL